MYHDELWMRAPAEVTDRAMISAQVTGKNTVYATNRTAVVQL